MDKRQLRALLGRLETLARELGDARQSLGAQLKCLSDELKSARKARDKPWHKSPGVMVAVLSLLVAVGAAYYAKRSADVATEAVEVAKDALRLSARPVISISPKRLKGRRSGWRWKNVGPGTALIEWFEVTVDGESQSDWLQVGRSLGLKYFPSDSSDPVPGTKLGAGDQKVLLELWLNPRADKSKATEAVDQFIGEMDRVKISACYCSLLARALSAGGSNECWVVTSPPQDRTCNQKPDVEWVKMPEEAFGL